MAERALITGVTGFVGRHLCQHLMNQGDEVAGIANTWQESLVSWGELPESRNVLFWDLAKPGGPPRDVVDFLGTFRPTVIYHLAAISVPEMCGDTQPTDLAWAVNVEGTRRLVELALSLSEPPRFIFASTSHVYRVPQDGITFVDETYPVQPRNPYGQTKLAAEEILLEAHQRKRLPVIIVRAFPHTGPGQSEKMMLPAWAAQFARGDSPVKIHTSQAVIDLCDVRDVVRAHRLLAERGQPGNIYLVGSGVPRTSGEVFRLLHRLADPARPVIEIRPGLKYDPIARIDKLTRTTGWKPAIPLETTVRDTYHWWLDRIKKDSIGQL